jgi:hypothetical protein
VTLSESARLCSDRRWFAAITRTATPSTQSGPQLRGVRAVGLHVRAILWDLFERDRCSIPHRFPCNGTPAVDTL